MEMPPEMTAFVTKVAGDHKPFAAGELLGAAPPPDPKPAPAADTDSPLWPAGVLIALAALVAAAAIVRFSGRWRPASG
jgi:4'-phosphopantetheinyl transferase EntD